MTEKKYNGQTALKMLNNNECQMICDGTHHYMLMYPSADCIKKLGEIKGDSIIEKCLYRMTKKNDKTYIEPMLDIGHFYKPMIDWTIQ